jgi:hypothetical protein
MKTLPLLAAVVAVTPVVASAGLSRSAADTIAYAESPRAVAAESLVADGFTGFEAPDFGPGSIDGQNGWNVSSFTDGTDAAIATVSEVNPADGLQHLRLEDQPLIANGEITGAFSPTLSSPGSFLSVDVNISNFGGSDYRIQPQTPSAQVLTAVYQIRFNGDIRVVDTDGLGGLVFVDTGVNFTPGVYQNYTMVFNPTSIEYFLDGNLIYTGDVITETFFEEIYINSDNFALTGETGDFDNVSTVVPEPATAGLLGLAGIAALRRRRA